MLARSLLFGGVTLAMPGQIAGTSTPTTTRTQQHAGRRNGSISSVLAQSTGAKAE